MVRIMLSQIQKPHLYPWIALFSSFVLLVGALGFQHIGGLAPCQMCYWQRHAHKIIMLMAVIVLLYYGLSKNEQALRPLLLLIIAAALGSFFMAMWHVGVEYEWWAGPQSCAVDPNQALPTGEDILRAFGGDVDLPSCADVPWNMFGLSMAAYNAIASLMIAGFGMWVLVHDRNG